jgi:hypothetical protein
MGQTRSDETVVIGFGRGGWCLVCGPSFVDTYMRVGLRAYWVESTVPSRTRAYRWIGLSSLLSQNKFFFSKFLFFTKNYFSQKNLEKWLILELREL